MKKTIDELRAALKSSVVNFTFTKLNGEVRQAKGTTNPRLVSGGFPPTGNRKPSDKVLTYFDLGANGFRCVSVDASISF